MNTAQLLSIREDIVSSNRPKQKVLVEALKRRLDRSLELYQAQLQQQENFLSTQKELKLLRNLRK